MVDFNKLLREKHKMAGKANGKAPAPVGFDFGNPAAYSQGGNFNIPEGDYIWTEVRPELFQPEAKKSGAQSDPFLAVVIKMRLLSGGEGIVKPYSLGQKAHLSWQVNEEGTGIIPIENGLGQNPTDKSNWALLFKSLVDSGLPQGVLQNDLSVLDGIWVHMQNVPEPEERRSYARAQTGDAEAASQQPRMISIVSEIKEDGKPWEGTGGVPEVEEAAPAPAKAPAKAAPKPTGKPAAKVAAAPEPEGETEADVASSAVESLLSENPNGIPRLQVKTGTFKIVNSKHGQAMANKVSALLNTEAGLLSIIQPLGYQLKGSQVVPA